MLKPVVDTILNHGGGSRGTEKVIYPAKLHHYSIWSSIKQKKIQKKTKTKQKTMQNLERVI